MIWHYGNMEAFARKQRRISVRANTQELLYTLLPFEAISYLREPLVECPVPNAVSDARLLMQNPSRN